MYYIIICGYRQTKIQDNIVADEFEYDDENQEAVTVYITIRALVLAKTVAVGFAAVGSASAAAAAALVCSNGRSSSGRSWD